VYDCLPCPVGKLCPGDGHTYQAPQLNTQYINHNTAKHIAKINNNSYIVSSDPSNRVLFRKKLKKLGKIVKTGLTVAAIVKTGGVAALKTAAAAKLKQIAIKKGLQCLKNGLSNFCNGKKGLLKSPKLGLKSAVKKNAKLNLGKTAKKITNKTNSKRTKVIKAKPRVNRSKASSPRASKTKGSKKSKASKTKPRNSKTKGSSKPKPSRINKTPSPINKTKVPCSNIFDKLANKVNNATRHIADKAVNRGRDWLKKNIGGGSGCPSVNTKKSGKFLRGSRAPKPKTDDSISSNPTTEPPNDDVVPKTKPPVVTNDDIVPTPRPITKRKKSNPKTKPPVVTNDDIVPTTRPITKRKKSNPNRKAPTNDDVVPRPRPITKHKKSNFKLESARLEMITKLNNAKTIGEIKFILDTTNIKLMNVEDSVL
jgi:hypothetical protein